MPRLSHSNRNRGINPLLQLNGLAGRAALLNRDQVASRISSPA